ncbi:MAG: RNA polymerase sigma factor [bacterium]
MPELTEKSVPHHKSVFISDFATIAEKYQRRLVAIAYRMLGNFEDARDSVQEVLVKFLKTNKLRSSEHEIFQLLTRILVNFCIDQLRKRKVWRFFSFTESGVDSLPGRNPDPDQEINRSELNALLEKKIDKLKPRQKAIYILRDVEGYSVRETANLVGCSENSVLANLHLARQNLRKWLKPYLQE